jgi:hypothetical protein
VLCWLVLQGNVFTFLQQSGGRLPESVVVPMILEPTMSALHYIHGLVRVPACMLCFCPGRGRHGRRIPPLQEHARCRPSQSNGPDLTRPCGVQQRVDGC